MITSIHPKLPMRNKAVTLAYYTKQLGFENIGAADFPDYLILRKDQVEVHFFLFPTLNPNDNYGQIYLRTDEVHLLYQRLSESGVAIHPNGALSLKPWGQIEFALLDPDNNLLTFGQSQEA